jgi:periplasmic protein TonB
MRTVMMPLRTLAIVLSLGVHASLGYAMLPKQLGASVEAFDAGTGNDSIFVEQGIALEGLSKLGDAIETIETTEVAPAPAEAPPPMPEVKPVDELRDAITSQDSKVEDNIVKAEEPPPETPPPQQVVVQAQEQPQQVALVTQQSSGEEKTGSINTTARTQYLGKLRDVLEKAKINPRSRLAGTVIVKFKIGADGELISKEITTSSGSSVLDEAAVAALERAAPFPPMPSDVAHEPMVVSVPFKFITR